MRTAMHVDRHVSFSIMVVVVRQAFAMQVVGGKFYKTRGKCYLHTRIKIMNLSKAQDNLMTSLGNEKCLGGSCAWRLMMRSMSC